MARKIGPIGGQGKQKSEIGLCGQGEGVRWASYLAILVLQLELFSESLEMALITQFMVV
jgi:hypothetical protein